MNGNTFHVSLTGHRPTKLAGYDLSDPFYEALRERLKRIILEGLQVHGHLTLHSGMALGADTVWSQAILAMRHHYPDQVSFVAEVPVMTQSDRWPSQLDRDRWKSHVEAADVVNVYAQSYSPKCLWDRNYGMVDASSLLLAVWDGQPGGGTAGAVEYARRKGCEVFILNPAWFRPGVTPPAMHTAAQAPATRPTVVVNKRLSTYDVYIGRGSLWGNPFVVGRDGTREEVVAKYEQYFLDSPVLKAQVHTLKGKRLGCFCKPAACHGDVLARHADAS